MPVMSLYDKEKKQWEEIPALKGTPATVEVGEVTSVAQNQPAKIENVGTDSNAVFNFQIPRGESGITPVRGTDYWTAADQQQIINDVARKMNYQFTELMTALNNKPMVFVIQDKATLDTILDLENDTIFYNQKMIKLNPGDMFLLVSTDEPDYWFGEDLDGNKLHELDARKTDLQEYVKKSQIQVMTLQEYSALPAVEPDVLYFIIEK